MASPNEPVLPRLFPNLTTSGFRVTSPRNRGYNCVAWAAGADECNWWPDPFGLRYWPEEVPRDETLGAFLAAYGTLGYTPCDGDHVEPGFEKVAIYVDSAGTPTHAARQLPSGLWTSKLGQLEDIEHDLAGLVGGEYGAVAQILQRAAR